MPRSHGVIKVEVWEARSDFRQLSLDAQWTYAMLISQPQINNLGVLPYVPEKWARLAADLDDSRLLAGLQTLEWCRYTITDKATREILVRTFIRHDAVWKQPRLVTNARKLYRETESQAIADYLSERHPWLTDETWAAAKIHRHETRKTPPGTPPDTPLQTPPDTPLTDEPDLGVTKPLSRGVSPLRAHAQEGLPLPLGLPQPLGQSLSVQDPTKAVRARDASTPAQRPLDHLTVQDQIDQSLEATR